MNVNSEKFRIEEFDHLYFDYNSLIHPCCHKVLSKIQGEIVSQEHLDQLIIKETLEYTRMIIAVVVPRKSIVISVDGVAPKAKMNQQRERRFRSKFTEPNKIWDTNVITPGTKFMDKLQNVLVKFQSEFQLEYTKLHPNLNIEIIISGATISGEGEHKLIKMISDSPNNQDTHCIYGLDADLIMLSILSKKNENIYLFRDRNDESEFQILIVKNLKRFIVKEINNDFYNNLDSDYVIKDYILFCFFLGNDFVPSLPCLKIKEQGINVLMDVYKFTFKSFNNTKDKQKYTYLVDSNNQINSAFFKDMIKYLVMSEHNLLQKHLTKIVLKESVSPELLENPKLLFNKTNYIDYSTNGYIRRYYNYFNINNVESCIKEWIQSLSWILGYYLVTHSNNDWYYPCLASPFLIDIDNFLKNNKTLNLNIKFKDTKAIEPIYQIFSVLPPESFKSALDSKTADKMLILSQTAYLKDYFPERIFIDVLYKNWLWEGKSFVPIMDDKIYDLLKMIL